MKKRDVRRVVGIIAGFTLLSSHGAVGEQTDSDGALAAVRAQVQAYERAWNTHDPSAVAAFYSPDADMVMGNSPRIVGREAIAEWWGRYFSAISDERVGTIQLESLRLLTPHVALANVTTLTSGREDADHELPSRRARGTWIMTMEGGQWLISALRGLPAVGERRLEAGTDR